MDTNTILKNIKGLASPSEREELLNWVDENDENANLFYAMQSGYVFDKLPYKALREKHVNEIMGRIERRPSLIRNLLKVVAILLIPLTLYTVYELYLKKERAPLIAMEASGSGIPVQSHENILYKVNPGVKGQVMLPDGSSVWLNSNSTLNAPAKFDSLVRIVELNGEGYFYIESFKDWPMYVKTKKGIMVKVKGTEFNLSSYEDEKELKFTLLSGEASLIKEHTNQEISVRVMEEIVIQEGEASNGTRGEARVRLNTGWKDGLLVFEDTPMSVVIKKLERWYGVSITVRDNAILSYCFTATFSDESITQVLELLKITSNIGYSIENKQVILFFK